MKTARYFIKQWYNHWADIILPAQNENRKLEEDVVQNILLSNSYPKLTKHIFNSVIVIDSLDPISSDRERVILTDFNIEDLVLETARISVSGSTKMFTFRCLCAPEIGQAFWVRSNNWYTLDRFRELCRKEESGEEF